MTTFLTSFWGQAAVIGLLMVAIYARDQKSNRWVCPRTWHEWREIIASTVIAVALFALLTSGKGCGGDPPWGRPVDDQEDAPDPFGRG